MQTEILNVKRHPPLFRLLVLLHTAALGLALSGCGQRGPLRLPVRPPDPSTLNAPATPIAKPAETPDSPPQ
jgi:predicted small lipoprotein YifL